MLSYVIALTNNADRPTHLFSPETTHLWLKSCPKSHSCGDLSFRNFRVRAYTFRPNFSSVLTVYTSYWSVFSPRIVLHRYRSHLGIKTFLWERSGGLRNEAAKLLFFGVGVKYFDDIFRTFGLQIRWR